MTSNESTLQQAIGLLVRYLSYRNRSANELVVYLHKKHVEDKTIEAAVAYAQENGLVDDAAFSSEWIGMRLRQGKGDMIIRMELKQKGVAQDIVQDLLSAVPAEEWQQAMERVIQKKNIPADRLLIRKALYQRGFSSYYIDLFLQYKVQ